MEGMTLERLQVLIEAQTRGFRQEISNVQNEVRRMTGNVNREVNKVKNIFKGLGKIVATIGIAKLAQESTKAAMSVESSIENINRTMQGNAKVFGDWVKSQSQSYGMSIQEAYKYGSTYSNLLSSFKSNTKELQNDTQELMQATAIIASKTGRTFEDTAERIRSGMLGSTEAIEDLGVYTNVSMIESTEAFKRFAGDSSWAKLDFQTQQQIRLAAILEQTYARYGTTLADTTQTRHNQFIASLKNVQLTLGQAFLPIYNAILPPLTIFINALGKAISVIAQFTTALFGKPKVAAQQTESINNQANAVGGLGDSLDSAEDSAKKAKKAIKSLAGIDEINTLSKGSDVDGGSGGGSSGGIGNPLDGFDMDGGGFLSSVTEVSDKVKEMTDKIKGYINTFNFEPLIESFNRVKKSVEPIINNLGKILSWFFVEILGPLAKWTISDLLPSFLNLVAGALDFINPILEVFMDLGKWLWDEFLQPIASWTGGVIVDVLNGLGDKLSTIGDWISENKPLVENLTLILLSFAAAWGLVTLAVGIWNIIGAIGTAITTGFGVAVAFLTSPIGLVILAIGAIIAIVVLLIKNWDTVKEVAINCWNSIKDVWSVVSEWFKTNVVDPIANFFSGLWDSIKNIFNSVASWFGEKFSGAWQAIKNAFSGVSSFFSNVWDTIKNMFTNIGSTIGNAIGGAFKTVVNSIISFAENTINGFIWAINGAIKVINKIPGVNISTLSTLDIPKLARGGIVDSPTIAMVGEAGKEAVMPLENNTGWITDLASKVADRLPQGSGGSNLGDGDLILQIDGSVIGKVALKQLRKMQRQGNISIIPV